MKQIDRMGRIIRQPVNGGDIVGIAGYGASGAVTCMSKPLDGRTIALPETRELSLLAEMLEQKGATTIRCPLVAIDDTPDAEPVLAWLRALASGEFHDLILMTGEGLRRLLGFAR